MTTDWNQSTHNDMSGTVNGNVFQAGKITVTIPPPVGDTVDPQESTDATEDDQSTGNGFGLLVVLVVGAVLLYLSQSAGNVKTTAFPPDDGSRPVGATDDKVRNLVGERMKLCASEVVLTPANCPQAVAEPYPARNVRWTLFGDPVDGLQIRWNDGRTWVLGTAVMTATYDTDQGPGFALRTFHFQSDFPWDDEKTRVENIYRVENIPQDTISKNVPSAPVDEVMAVVRQGFNRCVSASSSPLPKNCPKTDRIPVMPEAVWTLEGDPLLTSRQEQDRQFGLVHVVGSYALHARQPGRSSGQAPTYSQTGTFDAVVAVADDRPILLQIADR